MVSCNSAFKNIPLKRSYIIHFLIIIIWFFKFFLLWSFKQARNKNTLVQIFFKGCVCYIFASLFFMSKWEQLWNKEKHFLFHFKSFFRFRDNQIFNFSDIQLSWCDQMPKHETRSTFYRITWEVNTIW